MRMGRFESEARAAAGFLPAEPKDHLATPSSWTTKTISPCVAHDISILTSVATTVPSGSVFTIRLSLWLQHTISDCRSRRPPTSSLSTFLHSACCRDILDGEVTPEE